MIFASKAFRPPERQRADRRKTLMSSETTIPSFNPSGSEVVAEIKRRTEDLMEYLRASVPENRHRSIAMTNYEQAAMWAVKANFV
jgi:hypothetical protein